MATTVISDQIPKRIRFYGNVFSEFDLYRIKTHSDGNCFFHALLMAYFIPYRDSRFNGRTVDQKSIIKKTRKQLADMLAAPVDPTDPDSPSYYQTLGNGSVAELGEQYKEFSLEGMIQLLESSRSCGAEVLELTMRVFDKNIFFIHADTIVDNGIQRENDVYIPDDISIYTDRPSVVLIYAGNHYDTCALRENDGTYSTHFSFKHPLIKFLYQRILDKKS